MKITYTGLTIELTPEDRADLKTDLDKLIDMAGGYDSNYPMVAAILRTL
jgi:hypothetical protein